MAKKEKKPQYLTPAGEAFYPWLNKYDDRPIKGKPQKPAYKLNLMYDANNPAWLELKEKIDELVEASYEEAITENPAKKKKIVRKYPYEMEVDDDGEETGRVKFKLKQNAFFKDKKTGEEKPVFIELFRANGTPMNREKELIYGGSILKAAFTTRNYLTDASNEAGISVDLKAVQVLKLVSNQSRSASSYGFGSEDGYEGDDEEYEDDAEGSAEDSPAEADASDPTRF